MIRYQPFPSTIYQQRRAVLAERVPTGSIVVAMTADIFPSNADASHPFVPNSDFFYLTGLDQPDAVFWGIKSESGWTERLFIPESTPHSQLWEGEKYSKEQARALSGCMQIEWLSAWKSSLVDSIPTAKHIYLNLPTYGSAVETASERLADEITATFQRPVESLSRLVHTLRAIKDDHEIGALRHAIAITQQAFESTVPRIASCEYEYEIEAELIYHFTRQGAQGHAFEPIIAGGKNACTLHYTTNHARLNPGELLLLDFGAKWGHYNADITRVVPISGQFSPRQIQIYEAVHQVLEQSRESLKLGMTMGQWKKKAQAYMSEALVGLGLISVEAVEKEAQTKELFPHSIGHHLGLDVHDPCPMDIPIQPGMVLTCEPGLYLPLEQLGIRLETDLYVTANGIVDLGEQIPIHWQEIEKMTTQTIY